MAGRIAEGVSVKIFGCFDRVYLCANCVDFRKGLLSLSAFVQASLGLNPFENALFIFINKRKNSIKILYWDKTGFALWMKVLEKDRFPWLRHGETSTTNISASELEWLLNGIDIWKIKKHEPLNYSRVI